MLAAGNIDRAKALAEYMEKEFGVTPQNIDEKLKELEQEYLKNIKNLNIKEAV